MLQTFAYTQRIFQKKQRLLLIEQLVYRLAQAGHQAATVFLTPLRELCVSVKTVAGHYAQKGGENEWQLPGADDDPEEEEGCNIEGTNSANTLKTSIKKNKRLLQVQYYQNNKHLIDAVCHRVPGLAVPGLLRPISVDLILETLRALCPGTGTSTAHSKNTDNTKENQIDGSCEQEAAPSTEVDQEEPPNLSAVIQQVLHHSYTQTTQVLDLLHEFMQNEGAVFIGFDEEKIVPTYLTLASLLHSHFGDIEREFDRAVRKYNCYNDDNLLHQQHSAQTTEDFLRKIREKYFQRCATAAQQVQSAKSLGQQQGARGLHQVYNPPITSSTSGLHSVGSLDGSSTSSFHDQHVTSSYVFFRTSMWLRNHLRLETKEEQTAAKTMDNIIPGKDADEPRRPKTTAASYSLASWIENVAFGAATRSCADTGEQALRQDQNKAPTEIKPVVPERGVDRYLIKGINKGAAATARSLPPTLPRVFLQPEIKTSKEEQTTGTSQQELTIKQLGGGGGTGGAHSNSQQARPSSSQHAGFAPASRVATPSNKFVPSPGTLQKVNTPTGTPVGKMVGSGIATPSAVNSSSASCHFVSSNNLLLSAPTTSSLTEVVDGSSTAPGGAAAISTTSTSIESLQATKIPKEGYPFQHSGGSRTSSGGGTTSSTIDFFHVHHFSIPHSRSGPANQVSANWAATSTSPSTRMPGSTTEQHDRGKIKDDKIQMTAFLDDVGHNFVLCLVKNDVYVPVFVEPILQLELQFPSDYFPSKSFSLAEFWSLLAVTTVPPPPSPPRPKNYNDNTSKILLQNLGLLGDGASSTGGITPPVVSRAIEVRTGSSKENGAEQKESSNYPSNLLEADAMDPVSSRLATLRNIEELDDDALDAFLAADAERQDQSQEESTSVSFTVHQHPSRERQATGEQQESHNSLEDATPASSLAELGLDPPEDGDELFDADGNIKKLEVAEQEVVRLVATAGRLTSASSDELRTGTSKEHVVKTTADEGDEGEQSQREDSTFEDATPKLHTVDTSVDIGTDNEDTTSERSRATSRNIEGKTEKDEELLKLQQDSRRNNQSKSKSRVPRREPLPRRENDWVLRFKFNRCHTVKTDILQEKLSRNPNQSPAEVVSGMMNSAPSYILGTRLDSSIDVIPSPEEEAESVLSVVFPNFTHWQLMLRGFLEKQRQHRTQLSAGFLTYLAHVRPPE
ncbi:unnamed protein product [Amoebophrya sp. A120]|nr:unnamed protein product [Amoebophrya sp. A120]|eukprot:GSA120T00023427001.1